MQVKSLCLSHPLNYMLFIQAVLTGFSTKSCSFESGRTISDRRGQNKPTKAEIVIPARICWFTTALPLALSWLDASRTLQNRLV